MQLSYRKETDPELIEAANAAYREAPPQHNTRRGAFARALPVAHWRRDTGPTAFVPRADANAPV